MKNLKKVVSLFIAMTMIMAMSLTVFADATTYALESDVSSHEFKAYQIFSGEQKEEDSDAYLYEVEWGSGVDGDALLATLKEKSDAFDDCTTATDVAEVLGGLGEFSAAARAFAKYAYEHITGNGITVVDGQTGLDAGYYLVVDVTKFAEGATDTYKNLALLQLTGAGEFDIASKVDIPSVEKKVQDINDTKEIVYGSLQDSADYDIGDDVPFTLTGTLPGRLTDYETYKYIFHDTLSAGLTYNRDAKVYLVNGTTETEVTGYFKVAPAPVVESEEDEATETIITVSCDNLFKIAAAGSETLNSTTKIVVRYTAELNENAKIGYDGNPNTVYLEYSNNPNESGEGDEHETGNTPEDTVIVFTYKLNVKKTDSKNKALAGAGFTLYKKMTDEKLVKVGEVTAGEDTEFSFTGIDDGTYVLVETTVPEGYNQADDLEFIVTAEHEVLAVSPKLTKLETNKNTITVEKTLNNAYYTGVLSTTVVNNAGHVLPETGGMGTTIFYVVGAVLVLGAAVTMITRKRMSK